MSNSRAFALVIDGGSQRRRTNQAHGQSGHFLVDDAALSHYWNLDDRSGAVIDGTVEQFGLAELADFAAVLAEHAERWRYVSDRDLRRAHQPADCPLRGLPTDTRGARPTCP